MPSSYPRRFRFAWFDPCTNAAGIGPWKNFNIAQAAEYYEELKKEFPFYTIMLEREDNFIWRCVGLMKMTPAGEMLAKLTPRELETLEKFMAGQKLTKTERFHKQSVLRKFDCHGDQLHRIYYPGILAEYRGLVKLRRTKDKQDPRKET